MSTALLVTLTVVEIVALVVVLALFVIVLTRRLRSVADTLRRASLVIRAVQGDVCLVGAGAAILNGQLDVIARALPAVAERAESLPRQQVPAQRTSAGQTPAKQKAAQDPMIGRR